MKYSSSNLNAINNHLSFCQKFTFISHDGVNITAHVHDAKDNYGYALYFRDVSTFHIPHALDGRLTIKEVCYEMAALVMDSRFHFEESYETGECICYNILINDNPTHFFIEAQEVKITRLSTVSD